MIIGEREEHECVVIQSGYLPTIDTVEIPREDQNRTHIDKGTMVLPNVKLYSGLVAVVALSTCLARTLEKSESKRVRDYLDRGGLFFETRTSSLGRYM